MSQVLELSALQKVPQKASPQLQNARCAMPLAACIEIDDFIGTFLFTCNANVPVCDQVHLSVRWLVAGSLMPAINLEVVMDQIFWARSDTAKLLPSKFTQKTRTVTCHPLQRECGSGSGITCWAPSAHCVCEYCGNDCVFRVE